MFEIGTTGYLWEVAKKYPVLSEQPNTLKPLGYAHMINLIEAFNPEKLLEFGHGSGSFLFNIFKDKLEMWGLDDYQADSKVISKDLKLIRRINKHVKFVSGLMGSNLKELPENYFDFVCSVSVLEHIPHENLNSVFEETFKILKPGGIVAHSYDVYYSENTKPVFDAFEKSNFQWLKPRGSMNVIWENWLNEFDTKAAEKLFFSIVFENPMFVAEKYMWQIERRLRLTPPNYVTILTAARKPLNDSGNKIFKIEKDSPVVSKIFLPVVPEKFISPEKINDFTYSKISHFNFFKENNYDMEFFKREVDKDYCDLKVYQDLLIYSFIKENLKKGSKILDIGGGKSRVLNYFKNDYECWNIDDFDRTTIETDGIKLISDRLGNFNKGLPSNYFDFTFSISTFIHSEKEDKKLFKNILKDNNRILKRGKFAAHCLVLLYKEPLINQPYILEYFLNKKKILNDYISFFRISIDQDLYYMSEKFYEDTWQKILGKSYDNFGKPFSYNLFWKK